jgi:hypothetical protein
VIISLFVIILSVLPFQEGFKVQGSTFKVNDDPRRLEQLKRLERFEWLFVSKVEP